MKMRLAAGLLLTAVLLAPAMASSSPATLYDSGNFPLLTTDHVLNVICPNCSVTASPVQATTTATGSTITTHLTFQQALAANASRKGCLIVNTSSDTELVFFGATGSATATNSIPIAAGASVNCASGLIVASDNIAITSKVTDGATYMVNSQ